MSLAGLVWFYLVLPLLKPTDGSAPDTQGTREPARDQSPAPPAEPTIDRPPSRPETAPINPRSQPPRKSHPPAQAAPPVPPLTAPSPLQADGPETCGPAVPPDVQLEAGDVIVAERDRVTRVDPLSGRRAVISAGCFLNEPKGVAIREDGHIFVVDPTSFRQGALIEIDPKTGKQTVRLKGGPISEHPSGIKIEPSGSVLIANTNGGTITRIDLDKRTAAPLVAGRGILKSPRDIAFDADGSIVIADDERQILRLSSGGLAVLAAGPPLQSPMGVVVVDGDVFVADLGAKAILRVRHGSAEVFARPEKAANPVSIAAHSNLLYVLDRANGVTTIDLQTGDVRWLDSSEEFHDASGIAVLRRD
jgi:DNA-binding beta-propeller fold protein YncE